MRQASEDTIIGLWDSDQCSAWITHLSLLYSRVRNTFQQLLNKDFSYTINQMTSVPSNRFCTNQFSTCTALENDWLLCNKVLERVFLTKHLLDQDVRWWVMFTQLETSYVNISNHNTAAQAWNINKWHVHFPCTCSEENFIAQETSQLCIIHASTSSQMVLLQCF